MSRVSKYAKKARELRSRLWPEINFQEELWHRKLNDGFITMPRTMPIILSIIDDLTKGVPASSTYLELWCRSYDEMYVSLSKSKEMACHAGFSGQRAERTWSEKIRALEELGFISIKAGQAGPLSHALVLNPYRVIERLYAAKTPGLTVEKYNAFIERALEIGALESPEEPKKSNPFSPRPSTAAALAEALGAE
jgi:hypothetical protein